MTQAPRNLATGFLRSARRFPDRPALVVADRTLSYAELRDLASRIAGALRREAPNVGPPLCAVFAYRSVTAFAGVLGALIRGLGYVPLNPTFPVPRTRSMLERSQCNVVVADGAGEAQLEEVLRGVERSLVLVFPDMKDTTEARRRFPGHVVLGVPDLRPEPTGDAEPVSEDSIAYILFTSGSTGVPKGVMVAHRNVTHFVDVMTERYEISETDRLSQLFDMTFDLSAFDMFVAWERGACVCCPSASQKMLPANWVRESGITVWFSVPSTGSLLKKLRLLVPSAFPGLRLGLFCGEALPADVARAWSAAAPNAIIENLYGPTELTIACALYRWDPDLSPAQCEGGVVPIGEPYPGMEAVIVDDDLRPVPDGETGELLMTGPQLTLGYWLDPDTTKSAWTNVPGREGTYYRTGDVVRRPQRGSPMVYLGRRDGQVKIQGYRVELGEVEAVLRSEAGVDEAVAIAWPRNESSADGIVAFLETGNWQGDELLERLRKRLPAWMLPREVRTVPGFPLSSNGKIDRKALLRLLDA